MRTAFCRGQFFSADFVVAIVTVCFGLGVLLHSGQLAMDSLGQYAMHQDNSAETVAGMFASGQGQMLTANMLSNTCWQYSNGTGSAINCTALQAGCAANNSEVFSAARLVACGTSACLLTVNSCNRGLT
jgi:hypothetical protein